MICLIYLKKSATGSSCLFSGRKCQRCVKNASLIVHIVVNPNGLARNLNKVYFSQPGIKGDQGFILRGEAGLVVDQGFILGGGGVLVGDQGFILRGGGGLVGDHFRGGRGLGTSPPSFTVTILPQMLVRTIITRFHFPKDLKRVNKRTVGKYICQKS